MGNPAASTTAVASGVPHIYLVVYIIVNEERKLNVCVPATRGAAGRSMPEKASER